MQTFANIRILENLYEAQCSRNLRKPLKIFYESANLATPSYFPNFSVDERFAKVFKLDFALKIHVISLQTFESIFQTPC